MMLLMHFVLIVYHATPSSQCSQECQVVLGHPNCKLLPEDDKCGVDSELMITPRIVGGEDAIIGAFPWMACLINEEYNPLCFCGGALLNRLYVLTAAHCLDQDRFWLLLGEHDQHTDPDCFGSSCAPHVQRMNPRKVFIHESYASSRDDKMAFNDIGLVRLEAPAELNRFVSPICLPLSGLTDTDNMQMTIAGWGGLERGNKYSQSVVLQTLSVTAVPNEQCRDQWAYIGPITENNICIDPLGNGIYRNPYFGDSGGPLMTRVFVDDRVKYFVIGVGSFLGESRTRVEATVYTRVTAYIAWILDHIEP